MSCIDELYGSTRHLVLLLAKLLFLCAGLISKILQPDYGIRPGAGSGNLSALLKQAEQWLEAIKNADMVTPLENAEEEVG